LKAKKRIEEQSMVERPMILEKRILSAPTVFRAIAVNVNVQVCFDVEQLLGERFCVEAATDMEEAWRMILNSERPYQLVVSPKSCLDDVQIVSFSRLRDQVKVHHPQTEVILARSGNAEQILDGSHPTDSTAGAGSLTSELVTTIYAAAKAQEQQRHLKETNIFKALIVANTALLDQGPEEAVLENILRAVQSLGFDRVRLHLLEGTANSLIGIAQVGMKTKFIGHQRPLVAPLSKIFSGPEPRLFSRTSDTRGSLGGLWEDDIEEWVGVPVIHKGEYIGVLTADNQESRQPIFAEDLAPLPLFAMQAKVAIENHLVTEVQDKLSNLKSVLQVYTRIGSSLKPDQVLSSACQSAVRLVGIDHSSLVLFSSDLQGGEVHACYPAWIGGHGLKIPLTGSAIQEQLIRRRLPLLVSDVEHDLSLGPLREVLNRLNVRSTIIVPVESKGRIKGFFSLDSISASRHFKPEEVELAKIFASQVAVAIENAELYEQTRQRAAQLAALRETTLAITSSIDRAELLQTILEQALKLFKAQSCGVYEYYPERKCLTIIAEHNRGEDIGKDLKEGEGMAGRLVLNKEPYMIIDDYKSWEGRAGIYQQRPSRAVLGVPLKWREEIIGVLYVDDKVGRLFRPEDGHLLSMFADHAAVAITTVKLMALNRSKVARLEQLSAATHKLMSRLDSVTLEERLEAIAKHTAQTVQAEICRVFLVREEGALTLEASYGHGPGGFEKGERFNISDEDGAGLIAYVASKGKVFNSWGDCLLSHPALSEHPDSLGQSRSLLAVPIWKKTATGETLAGLLQVSNKIENEIGVLEHLRFGQEDEWLLQILAEAVLIAIENIGFVEALDEQKGRLKNLISSVPSGVISVDQTGTVDRCNEGGKLILGYSVDENVPSDIAEIFYDPNEAAQTRKRLELSPNGKLKEHSTFARNKEGEPVPIVLSINSLLNKDGKPEGAVGHFVLQNSGSQTKLLLEATGIVAQAESLKQGLQDLAQNLAADLSSTFCRILLLDETGANLSVAAAYHCRRVSNRQPWSDRLGSDLPLREYPGLKAILRSGKPRVLRLEDGKVHEQLQKFSRWIQLEKDVQSLLLIPLKLGEQVVGLLDVGEVRSERRSPFSKNKVALAAGIAEQISILIDRQRLHEVAQHRARMLTALAERIPHLRGEKEPDKLHQEFMRLAAEIVDGKAAVLFTYQSWKDKLKLGFQDNVSSELEGVWLNGVRQICHDVAHKRKPAVVNGYTTPEHPILLLDTNSFKNFFGIPLKDAAGEVVAVLLIANNTQYQKEIEVELEVLERFAAHASIAIQTSSLMHREQRMLGHQTILHQVFDYIQEKRDLKKAVDCMLTGITAGYGLGFNRAALLLLEENQFLVGSRAIGYIDKSDAVESWNRDHRDNLYDFKNYKEQLENGIVQTTPVGDWIVNFRCRITRYENNAENDIFSQVVKNGKSVILARENLSQLPREFSDFLKPCTEVAVVPLLAREQVTGLLVVDNKFTQSAINEMDLEPLLAFANTAAIAFDNIQLFDRLEAGREKIRSFFEASNELLAPENPNEVLQKIVERTRLAAGANWARIILVDQAGRTQILITTGEVDNLNQDYAIREDGVVRQVIRDGKARFFENTHDSKDDLHPGMVQEHPEAMICLPLSLQGRVVGVVWVSYNRPVRFDPFEINAMQLYVNQAAIAYDSTRRMRVLANMHQAVETMAKVLKQIVECACEVLEADSAALWPYAETRNRFVPEALVTKNIPEELVRAFEKAEPREGGTAYTVMSDELVCVEDVSHSEKYPFLGDSTINLLSQIGVQSFIGISLNAGDEKLGVLYVNYKRPRSFLAEEKQTAQTFTNHAALASKKAKLLDQVQKARDTAVVVAHVTALEKGKSTLRSIVRGTRETLNADAVTLYSYNPDQEEFSYPPEMSGVVIEPEVIKLGRVTPNSVVRKILALNGLHVAEDSRNDEVLGGAFVHRENVASSVGIPLVARDRKVGVMFVNYHVKHNFTKDDLTNIGLFATQAAVAIRNTQLYEQVQKRVRQLEILYQAGQTLPGTCGVKEILEQIAEYAWQIAGCQGQQARFVDVKVVSGMKVELAATHPTGEEERVLKALGPEIDLGKPINGRIGIVGKALRENGDQLVNDVENDEEYICIDDATKAQIVVLIKNEEQAIGAISVEHSLLNAFDELDLQALKSLALQANVAIQNARQREELSRTKTAVEASTAIAWMGMVGGTWFHAISGHAITITDEIAYLRSELTSEYLSKINPRLSKIERLANLIHDKPLVPSLTLENAPPFSLNDWVITRTNQLVEAGYYPGLSFTNTLEKSSSLPVRIVPDWLRQVLDFLVDNAVKSMADRATKSVQITTCKQGRWAELTLTDNGRGIADDIREKLFVVRDKQFDEAIDKAANKGGLGRGLLMAKFILDYYGGEIDVRSTSPAGTTMIVRLPLDFCEETDSHGGHN
jgi:PAS domain S-box-containing protein